MIEGERSKDGGTILTYNYLLPNWMRQHLIKIKQEVENEVKGCKIMIYDPTHPRKNITLSITGISTVIEKTKESIIIKLNNLEGVYSFFYCICHFLINVIFYEKYFFFSMQICYFEKMNHYFLNNIFLVIFNVHMLYNVS